MVITKVIYKCDICGKETEKKREVGCSITFTDNSTDMYEMYGGNDIEYKQVCPECAHMIRGYIRELITENLPKKTDEISKEIEVHKDEA